MKVSVILAHPNIKSFNHAIANSVNTELVQNGHDVYFHDLYTEKFDALLPADEISKEGILPPAIDRHCRELSSADGIIIIHPNWWGQPPAILKGWIDRVIRPGAAYRFDEGDQGEGVPIGLLKAKAALVFNTSNTSPEREAAVFGDPLDTIWKNCIFGLCGVKAVHREVFSMVVTSPLEQRQEWLLKVKEVVRRFFP